MWVSPADDKQLDIAEYTDGMAAYGVNDAAGAFKKFAVVSEAFLAY